MDVCGYILDSKTGGSMLTWEEFKKEKRSYSKVWDNLKAEFSGEIRKFLDKSYLVVAYNYGQVPFELSEPSSIALESPAFFISNSRFEQLAALIKEFNAFNEYNSNKKSKIRKELEKFNPSELKVKDFRAEVRFPALKFAYIQEIKQSRYCDREVMDMSTVSINVILQKEQFFPKE